MNEKPLNLHQKLIEIRKNVPYLQKDTQSFKYKYVVGTDVLAPIVEKMNELNVLLISNVHDGSVQFQEREKVDKETGNIYKVYDRIVKADMLMLWIDADNPDDKIPVKFLLFGEQDDVSKAFGSGLTYSERYFLLKFFNIATDKDDPDVYMKKHGIEGNGEKKKEEQKKDEHKKKDEKSKELNPIAIDIMKRLKKDFPKQDGADGQAKRNLMSYVFATSVWDFIVTKKSEILKQGLEKINAMLDNGTIVEILLGNQDGALFDPREGSISTDGEIEQPVDKFTTLDKFQALKRRMPEDDYYHILETAIPGSPYKKSNKITDSEHINMMLATLETNAKIFESKEKGV